MKRLIKGLFIFIMLFGLVTIVNAEDELKSTMFDSFNVDVGDIESLEGSFVLNDNIDFEEEKANLVLSIKVTMKESGAEYDTYNDSIKTSAVFDYNKDTKTITYLSELPGANLPHYADANYVATITITNEEGKGEEIVYDIVAKKITSLKTIGEEKKEDKTITLDGQDSVGKVQFDAIKEDGNKVTYQYMNEDETKVAYAWTFDGSKMDTTDFNIDLSIKIGESTNKKEIESLVSNKDNSLVIEFAYHGNLPKGTSVKLYVNDKYKDGDKVTLSYYNEDTKKLEVIAKDLEVKDGYVTFALEHCSQYVLEKQETNSNPKTNDNIIKYIVLLMVSLVCIYISINKIEVN